MGQSLSCCTVAIDGDMQSGDQATTWLGLISGATNGPVDTLIMKVVEVGQKTFQDNWGFQSTG